jgi:hypothetical protein
MAKAGSDIEQGSGGLRQPALSPSATEPVPVSAHSGDGQAQGHTPIPWRVEKAVNGNWIEAGHASAPVSIARTFYNDVGSVTEDANAAFIVKAVNSHDALVTALRDILDNTHVGKAGQIVTERSKYGNYPARCYHAARAALAFAEAGNG